MMTAMTSSTAAPHPWDAAAAGWDRRSAMLGDWRAEATASMLDIARHVGPAGRVLATDDSARILGLAADQLRRAGFPGVQTQVAAAQTPDLGGAGFDAAVSRLGLRFCPAPMCLPSCQHCIDFVQTAGLPIQALLAPLPAEAQRAARQDIAQQLDRFTADGAWVGPNELLLCSAMRPDFENDSAALER